MDRIEFGITLGQSQLKAIEEASLPNLGFTEIQAALGLNGTTDFQHANLKGVDFSNADLRGFDFTGSDLRESFGVGILLDSTTVFADAILQESPFSHYQRQIEFFRTPAVSDDYRVLLRDDWSGQITRMYRMRETGDAEKTKHFCKRLFAESKDAVVRSDMLRILGAVENDRREYASFLSYICSTTNDPSACRATTRVLSDQFRNVVSIFLLLFRLIGHDDDRVREEAYKGVLFSRHFPKVKDELIATITSEKNSITRRRFVSLISSTVADGEVVTSANRLTASHIDFAEPLTRRFLTRRAEDHNRSIYRVLEIVAALIEAGIPFRVDQAPDLWETIGSIRISLREREKGR